MSKKILFGIAVLVVLLTLPFSNRWLHTSPDLTVVGYIDMTQGLGRQSKELIDTFSNEMKVNFVPTKKQKVKKFKSLISRFKKKDQWGKVVIFEDMLWAPNFEKYKAILSADPKSIRIAYTMWESTKLPDEWVMILNEHFDAAVVPAPFLVDVYSNSGVKIPVFYLPLGLNLDPFLKQPLKKKAGSPFVFGNFSVCSARKNHITLIRAFAKAFGNDPNVQLRLNCRLGESDVSKDITEEIAKLGLSNIVFTQFKLSSDKYLDTFKLVDCYVSPSKGEGFSIQPREAMALGLPVIVTNNTGQIPICGSGLVRVVESPDEEVAIFPWGNRYGYYYNCSIDALAEALTDVKKNYDNYIKDAQSRREWAVQHEYENLKVLYKNLIRPQTVLLGEKNCIEPSAIITTSIKLKKKYEIILKK